MTLAKRLGLAVLLIAISVGLVNLPATASASSTAASSAVASTEVATSAAADRTVVNKSACTSATEKLPKAKKAAKRAKKKLAKKKRALRRAKKHDASRAKVKKAKRAVRKAKRALKKKRARVERITASKRRNCATKPSGPTTPSLSADQLGQLLALLSGAAGEGSDLPLPLSIDQFTDLLDGIVPGGAGALDPAVLTSLLAGFNSGALDPSSIDPAALTALLGGLSPDELGALLDGSLSHETALQMFQTFVAMFGGLAGGDFELPGDFDPSGLLDVVGGLLGGLLGGGLPDAPCLPLPLPLPIPGC